MKTVDTVKLRSHLDQQVTGLATCWEIEREDGRVFRFTDADEDLTIDGIDYSSIGAYKRTAIETTSSLAVDNLEVVGLASDLALPAQDLKNGLFDNARVSVFLCSWSGTIPGKVRLRRGFFGEVQTLPNETFQVELRGLMQRLAYNYMDIFNAACLYDLGSPGCGITIRPNQVKRDTAYVIGDTVVAAQSTSELSLRYEFTIGDSGFEDVAASGFSATEFWYDSGAVPMIFNIATPFTGTASLLGAAGSGTTTQLMNIEDNTSMDISVVTENNARFSLEGWRRNEVGSTGRVAISFLDEDANPITMGQSARSSARLRYANTFNIPGDFTVMFWINPDDLAEGGIMAGGLEEDPVLFNTGCDITYQNNTIEFSSNFFIASISSKVVGNSQTGERTRVEVGQWNHVCVTRSGTTTSLYINFELLDSTTDFTGPFYFEDLFADNDETEFGTAAVFDNGQLDDFRIYNVAKGYDELVIETKADPVLPDANLVRWFSFEDGTANDQSGTDPATPGDFGGAVTVELSTAPFTSTSVPVGFDSGFTDAGVDWVRFEAAPMRIPPHAKTIKLDIHSNGGAEFDEFRARVYDISQTDSTFLPEALNNVYWECTGDGTTALDYPATYVGGAGTAISDGTAAFIAVNAYLRAGRITSVTDRRRFTSEVSDIRAIDSWFQGGTVIFVTGKNAGAAMEVKSWVALNGETELFLSMPSDISVGDEFLVYPGCDKSRISCAAIFRNISNFFGFPDVPGQDNLTRYPDQKQ